MTQTPIEPDETNPRKQALALVPLLRNGCSADDIRALIRVKPAEAETIRALDPCYPVDAMLAERAAILEHFDSLLTGLAATAVPTTHAALVAASKREQIAQRLREGAKLDDIRRELHCAPITIRSVRRAIGMPDARCRFSCDEKRAIFRMREQGLTLREIAERMGHGNPWAVWNVLRHPKPAKPRAGRPAGQRRASTVDHAHLAELIERGMCSRAIAERLHVSAKTVRVVARQFGLAIRCAEESDAG